MIRTTLILATAVLFGTSCERHSWQSTKGLHHHGDKSHAHDDAHSQDANQDHAAPKPAVEKLEIGH